MKRRTVVDNTEAENRIQRLEEFRNKTGSLRGVREGASPEDIDCLPEKYWGDVRDAGYTVWSYGTPIAWVRPDGERVVPDIGYSLTTGQHQYIVKAAWRIAGWTSPGGKREVVKVPATGTLYGEPRRLRRGGIDGQPDWQY